MTTLADLAETLIGAVQKRYPGLREDDAVTVAGHFVAQLGRAVADGQPIAWAEQTPDGSWRCRIWTLKEVS